MEGPDSSYSCLLIHICWKVEREAKMEPPIHTEYLRSGGATTLIFMEDGASAVISFDMRSAMPGNMVEPPDSTMLPYRSCVAAQRARQRAPRGGQRRSSAACVVREGR